MQKLDHLGWVVCQWYEVAGHRFGVRTTSEEMGEWLDYALGEYRSDPDDDDPEYGLLVAKNSEARGTRGYHILYRWSGGVVRTMHLPTLGRSFLASVDALRSGDREDAVATDSILVRVNGSAVLLPSVYLTILTEVGRRADRAGVSLPIAEHVQVDLDSGLITPAGPTLNMPADVWRYLEALAETTGESDRFILADPTKVDVICTYGSDGTMLLQPATRGAALQQLAAGSFNLPKLGGRALEGLTRLVEGARCYGIGPAPAKDLLEALPSLVRN